MDKDEILKKSREENKNRDFVETEVLGKANGIALGVGMLVCCLISVLHAIFRDGPDYSAWTVLWAAYATVCLFKYAKLRRRHELLFGLLYTGFSLFFFAVYLHRTLGVF